MSATPLNASLRIAIKEVLCTEGAGILSDPYRLVSLVMDMTNPDDPTALVFANNCDAELLEPLRLALRYPTQEAMLTAEASLEGFLCDRRFLRLEQARRVACEVVFGVCGFVGIVPPDLVVHGALDADPLAYDAAAARASALPPKVARPIQQVVQSPQPVQVPRPPRPATMSPQPSQAARSPQPVRSPQPMTRLPQPAQAARSPQPVQQAASMAQSPVLAQRPAHLSQPSAPTPKSHKMRAVLVAMAALVIAIAVYVGRSLVRANVAHDVAGVWVVSSVSYQGDEDSSYWQRYCKASQRLELNDDGTCTYQDLPQTNKGTWSVGLPLGSGPRITLALEDGSHVSFKQDDDDLVLQRGVLGMRFSVPSGPDGEISKPDGSKFVGTWEATKTVRPDGSMMDKKAWDAARASDTNLTIDIRKDGTLVWDMAGELMKGSWCATGDQEAVYRVSSENDDSEVIVGLITLSDSKTLRFNLGEDDYGEYRKV